MTKVEEFENTDAVCCVASSKRDTNEVYEFLNDFLPNRKEINLDYCLHPEDETHKFKTELEMISCFVERKSLSQVFFWNEAEDSSEGWMLGVCFTKDGGTIFSITLPADGATEFAVLEKLKSYIQSDKGLVSYNYYPGFGTLSEFEESMGKYQNVNT
jgi:hypothetical protein